MLPSGGGQGNNSSTNHEEGSASSDADRLHDSLALSELEEQLVQAQSELEDYQRLLGDLPGIYEDKFRQKVRSVAQEIRHLLDERKALQNQVAHALEQAKEVRSLPAPGNVDGELVSPPPSPPAPPQPAPMGWSDVRLPRFPVVLVRLGIGVFLVLVVLGLQALLTRRMAPSPPTTTPPRPAVQPAAPGTASVTGRLTLQASGGQSWVLVEDLKGAKVFDAILEPGQSQVLSIGSGLRLRSGRPDLLLMGLNGQPAKRLGGVSDLDWVEIRP